MSYLALTSPCRTFQLSLVLFIWLLLFRLSDPNSYDFGDDTEDENGNSLEVGGEGVALGTTVKSSLGGRTALVDGSTGGALHLH